MRHALFAVILLCAPAAVSAESGRDALTRIAFTTRDKAAALAQIADVEASATATLARSPGDGELQMTRAMATTYRAKLTRNRSDALAAKAQLEALVATSARDPEALVALGAWHLNAVQALGGLLARGALGARTQTGLDLTDRAIALGGDRAVFPGLAGLLRLALDPKDARGANLIEAAAKGFAATSFDRAVQRRAVQMQAVLRGGDTRLVQRLATRLLPLGQFE